MKFVFAALLLALLAGCASEAEDRLFFERGWVLPERGAEERLNRQ
jgi:hypothetical protein